MRILALLLFFSSVFSLQAQSDTTASAADTTVLVLEEVNVLLEVTQHCVNGKNTLSWEVQANDSLHFTQKLGLYYRHLNDSLLQKIESLDSLRIYVNNQIELVEPGIYLIDYVDSANKLHFSSNEVFLEVCTQFQLPDVFNYAPGKFYEPSQINHIAKIELVIFNSGGEQVFFTKNPKVLWDGRNQNNGALCSPGTYFYNCDVYEDLQQGQVKRNVTGIIQLNY
ncbi:MAG: hypothetical protein EP332_03805 [Bacteroidetes bacterium]|nr:MAG: hypothetical protein EP332_03805 [Bacteroidota bacterium]